VTRAAYFQAEELKNEIRLLRLLELRYFSLSMPEVYRQFQYFQTEKQLRLSYIPDTGGSKNLYKKLAEVSLVTF